MDAMEELNAILDMLDEVEQRVDSDQTAYDKDEYVKSGIRTAKHHVFQAMRAIS